MESKINVSLRVKPLSASEKANAKNQLWSIPSESSLCNKRTNEVYQFDRVFGENESTKLIFDS